MRTSIATPAITRASREAMWPARLLCSCGSERAVRQGRARVMGIAPEPRPCSRFWLWRIPLER
jgi:hypothetical protein